ncbi:hypothetical protein PYCCODRAFT_1401627 [Trametes coccinea BRFM310]|uniref:Endopeptidase S2P n=1 Tax=Trametes coccinea (strain BRFM310) TaxID=1353009 RepID=A0A1Y2J2W4_TRAC3|nr:hypothetical protein PYCCODRAFT_1401627 [Trametes coccinea BRFM310]
MSSSSSHSELENASIWLLALWSALYALRYYRRRNRRITTLPSLTSSSWPASTELFKSPVTRITLNNLHLRYQSSAWNALHQSSSARLSKRTEWRRALQLVYDIGSALGVLGMLGSVLLLAWTSVQLAASLFVQSTRPNTPEQRHGFAKRELSEDGGTTVHEARATPSLQLIIPGLTVPLHHLPLLLLALLTTQVIHECGHAVAAALDSIPLTSAGLGLTVIIPSAFVAFPAEETESLPARSRIRLISAGAFHNLAFWLVLGFAAWLRTSDIVWPVLGYRDVSQYGRAVVYVDEHSPLYGHLPVGAVIYKVGDEMLADQEGASRKWETVMSASTDKSAPSLGWCTDEAWFLAQDGSCCTSRGSAVTSQSCFATLGQATNERCVDPLRFLQPGESADVRRCGSAAECGHSQLCVRPRGDQELVSLTMHLPAWLRTNDTDSERVVVWQGDRSEVPEEVEVGDWVAKYEWLPMGFPVLWGNLYMYLKMLTLSLYFLNLLPLPFIDGGQLFDALYDAYTRRVQQGREPIPLQHLEEGEEYSLTARRRIPSTTPEDTKRKARRAVHIGVGTTMGLCTVLSLLRACI